MSLARVRKLQRFGGPEISIAEVHPWSRDISATDDEPYGSRRVRDSDSGGDSPCRRPSFVCHGSRRHVFPPPSRRITRSDHSTLGAQRTRINPPYALGATLPDCLGRWNSGRGIVRLCSDRPTNDPRDRGTGGGGSYRIGFSVTAVFIVAFIVRLVVAAALFPGALEFGSPTGGYPSMAQQVVLGVVDALFSLSAGLLSGRSVGIRRRWEVTVKGGRGDHGP